MRYLIAITALLALLVSPLAIAQTGNPSSVNAAPKSGPLPAPVGHRQPRPNEVPSEKNLSNPNDAANREDAELDKKIKSICRGC